MPGREGPDTAAYVHEPDDHSGVHEERRGILNRITQISEEGAKIIDQQL